MTRHLITCRSCKVLIGQVVSLQAIKYIAWYTDTGLTNLAILPSSADDLPPQLELSWEDIQRQDFEKSNGLSFHAWWMWGEFAVQQCQNLLNFVDHGRFSSKFTRVSKMFSSQTNEMCARPFA